MNCKLFFSDTTEDASNVYYKHEFTVNESIALEALASAFSHDYTAAAFTGYRRGNQYFIGSNCLIMDCDNSDDDNPQNWKTPADVAEAFPDVGFIIHYSRNNMKQKGDKAPRPRFHVIFEVDYTINSEVYSETKRKVQALFPAFDDNALDSSRFFYGTKDAQVEIHEGKINLSRFLETANIPQTEKLERILDIIPEGSRNSTLSSFAAKILKRYGNTEQARKLFIEASDRCRPLLSHQELNDIWRSALKLYDRISCREDYIPPEKFNKGPQYQPSDFSHIGEAEILSKHYKDILKYSNTTGFLVFDGICWRPSETRARAIAQELTSLQLEEALKFGNQYYQFVLSQRSSSSISAILRETAPMVELSPDDLDRNPFLLCCPDGTIDLRFGVESLRPNCAEDYITKCCSVTPGADGEEFWLEFLSQVFCGNDELIGFVQRICGLAAIGRIYEEILVIAYGSGRNSKSTFWNVIRTVLGTYADGMSADILTQNCRKNVSPELAELKGKRLVIASETQQGARLNEALVKAMCSSDYIRGEKKFKDPFSFRPSHTVVLHTNHLPQVTSVDEGIWRRLLIIPFTATFEGNDDIKNFADILIESSGPAILKWIVQGAQLVICEDFRITAPECVIDAICNFKQDNDWFNDFLIDCCIVGEGLQESSSKLYQTYRAWAISMGEQPRSTTDFYRQVEKCDFKRITQRNTRIVNGVKLKSDIGCANA